MKRIFCLGLLLWAIISIHSACTTYRSLDHADKITRLAGNRFMKNLSRSIIHDIKELTQINHEGGAWNKIDLGSYLHSVVPVDLMAGFNQLLSKKYHISIQKLEQNSGSWKTVRDVVRFVGMNGSGFNFYKQ